jgi:hypothetical protein
MPIQEGPEQSSRLRQQGILFSVLKTTVLPRLRVLYDAEYDRTRDVALFMEKLKKLTELKKLEELIEEIQLQ